MDSTDGGSNLTLQARYSDGNARFTYRNEEAEEHDGVDHFKHSCGAVRAHLRTESYPISVISPVQIFLLRIKGR